MLNKMNMALFAVMLLIINVFHAAQADDTPPNVLVKSTTEEVTTLLKKDKSEYANDRQKLYALIDAKVLPHFDFQQMTQLAVGHFWRTASPAQQQDLVKQFRMLLVRTYAGALAAFNKQVIEFKPFSMAPDASDVTVETQVKQPGQQPIPINYSMKKEAGGWKVYDVSIDGVSLVLNYRGSFGSEIRQKGINGLIQTLTARNQQNNESAKK
ncbi:MAG: MlaC/ttg2D family ABC transporter substrate-binding protein [Burkholderiales bacterium]